jgi:pantoate--beta-alanine ligase
MMGKTIREKNGLALSSRNKYLKPEEVIIAKNIFKILKETRILIKKNKKQLSILKVQKRKLIACGFSNVEYFQILTNDLKCAKSPYIKSRIFIAAWIGSVRLIDNILI